MIIDALSRPPMRRAWYVEPRLCQTCGESHADGTPAPSGKECKKPVPKAGKLPTIKARDETTTIKCTHCKVPKLLGEYPTRRSQVCSACTANRLLTSKAISAANDKKWRASNRKRIAESRKSPERAAVDKIAQKAWRENNRDKTRAAAKKYRDRIAAERRAARPEKVVKEKTAMSLEKKQLIAAQQRVWRAANKEKIAAYRQVKKESEV